MAIDVTCAKCHTRFQVSEKFAGKSGPCPKCKAIIKIPEKKDEVVIHAQEDFGPKGTTGEAVFKPIARTEVRLQVPQFAAIIGSVLVLLIAAFVLRVSVSDKQHASQFHILLAVGAALLGPPLAFAGYTFLRDDELEPFRGREVLLRSLACGLAYATIWAAYWLIFAFWYDWKPLPSGEPNWQIMCAVVPAMLAIGAFAGQASFEFELTTGALHYSLYLVSTILLRLIMGLDPRWIS